MAESPDGIQYEVMEALHDEGRDGRTSWKHITSLTAASFLDKHEFQALEESLREFERYERDPSAPFARKGWLRELRSWVAEIIRPRGIELTEQFRQYNASPSFSLVRFETTGPALWFKAVGEPNRKEFPITLKLARLFPNYLPELLATRADWNSWLSQEAGGTNLSDTREVALWEKAAAALAHLQGGSIGKTESILDTGAHDLRVERLYAWVSPFLSVIDQLMQEQAKVPPPFLSTEELDVLGERIADSLALLKGLGMPEVLGHSDLNPGNIIVAFDHCVFVDWAEAHVGHPFFSFEYLLEHFRRTVGRDVVLESRLVSSYSKPWLQFFPDKVITEVLALAPLVAVFAYAISNDAWQDQERLKDSKVAGYFRSLARRMDREANQFIERRPRCLG